jgi:hypothetical protein
MPKCSDAGRARLTTNSPIVVGGMADPVGDGMMLVACLAARAGDVLITTMTVFSRIQRSTVLGVTRQRSA